VACHETADRCSVTSHSFSEPSILRWSMLIGLLGILTGSSCSLFLYLLDLATETRESHSFLLFFLPAAGAFSGWLYDRWGKAVSGGNRVILDEIANPTSLGVLFRMAPLVVVGTLMTHLFGGSAGREGTAVQMGGGFAGWLGRIFCGASAETRKQLLICGVAAGFSGVFGTPLAATLFVQEVLRGQRPAISTALSCFAVAVISDRTCLAWGTKHSEYRVADSVSFFELMNLTFLGSLIMSSVLFGLAARIYVVLAHSIQRFSVRSFSGPMMRPFIGGCVIILLVAVTGNRDALGLGVSSSDPGTVTIASTFSRGGAETWSWFWKIVFTAVTIGTGFRGGEVTPLFFIGATLGNALSERLPVPVDLLAAMGFVGVFAAATKTPLACTIMALELFGGRYAAVFLLCCFVANRCSGRHSVYGTERHPGVRDVSKD
jgi:H+/Cl- antiporter ClcA